MLLSKPMLSKVLGLVAECWPSLRTATKEPPCLQHQLFPKTAGWRHVRLLSFRCVNESHLGYEFEVTLESEAKDFYPSQMLELQPQNSHSKVALWLTQQQLIGCQTVNFQLQHVPLCQALASVALVNTNIPANLSEWLTQQGLLPRGRFTILQCWQHGNSHTLHCQTTDCLSRACYHWFKQQAIRFQLVYAR